MVRSSNRAKATLIAVFACASEGGDSTNVSTAALACWKVDPMPVVEMATLPAPGGSASPKCDRHTRKSSGPIVVSPSPSAPEKACKLYFERADTNSDGTVNLPSPNRKSATRSTDDTARYLRLRRVGIAAFAQIEAAPDRT